MGVTTNRTIDGRSIKLTTRLVLLRSGKRWPALDLDEKTAMAGRLQRPATVEVRAVWSKAKAKVRRGRRTWQGRRVDAAGHLRSPSAWRRSSSEDVLGPI